MSEAEVLEKKDVEFDYYLIDKLPPEKISSRSETKMAGCWEWTGKIDKDGYGKQRFYGRTFMAHRWVWECVKGWIPHRQQLDHLCKNRRCVNPAHLEPVAQKENLRRATKHNRGKTHCPQGHKYTELNTYRTSDGKRKCRTCNRERARQYRAEGRIP